MMHVTFITRIQRANCIRIDRLHDIRTKKMYGKISRIDISVRRGCANLRERESKVPFFCLILAAAAAATVRVK